MDRVQSRHDDFEHYYLTTARRALFILFVAIAYSQIHRYIVSIVHTYFIVLICS